MDTAARDSWCATFERSDRGKRALEALDKAFPPGNEAAEPHGNRAMRISVLHSCYGAAMFDTDLDEDSNQPNDPSKKATQAKKSIEGDLPSHKRAVTNMRRFARKHPHIAGVIFQQIVCDLIAKNIRILDCEKRDWAALMNCVLEIIETRLAKRVDFDSLFWPPLRPFDYGCFRYEGALHGVTVKHYPEVATMLLFDLVQTFRLRSQGVTMRKDGTPMPTSTDGKPAGKPHYQLATLFVNAAFKTPRIIRKGEKPNDVARNRLKALSPSVSYCAWPALRW